MSRCLPWYKREVDAWRGGTRGMSMELRGFYSECLDAMWDLQGPLPTCPMKLSVMLGTNPRTVRKLMPQLIGMGKILVSKTGYANRRMMVEIGVTFELDEAPSQTPFELNSAPIQIEFGSNSAPIQSEFNSKVPKKVMISTRVLEVEEEVEVEVEVEKKDNRARKRARATIDETILDAALSAYNASAIELGFSRCLSLTDGRRTALTKRLLDIGHGDASVGVEKFREALSAIPRWSFLAGREKPRDGRAPFKLDLERLLSTGSGLGDVLAKLMDLFGEHGAAPTMPAGYVANALNLDAGARFTSMWLREQEADQAAQRARESVWQGERADAAF